MISAAAIHEQVDWPAVLAQLGIPESALRNRHGPCPACGGKDCFRFDHSKRGKGSFYCNKIGSGDGFGLLEHVYGWPFAEARKRVIAAAGLDGGSSVGTPRQPLPRLAEAVAEPSRHVLRLRRECCAIEHCDDALDYLTSRYLWPLPPACSLKAHASLEYRTDEGQCIGRYPAIVADIVDVDGELVALHRTYLEGGRKLTGHEPRKQLGPVHGRVGCAVRLIPLVGETLGVGEGVETCLAAATLHGIPTWAALNTALLARFEPPPSVKRLIIFADRDEAGLIAAGCLMERLQGRVHFELRTPTAPAKDFNDALIARGS